MGLISEDHVLAAIALFFPEPADNSRLLTARDDDCAVIRADEPLCVSTDLFIEDVHFRRRYFSPGDTGWKALAVNLSDLAACGAKPLGFSLGLGLPQDADADFLHGLLQGMADLAGRTGVQLTGGDLSRSDKLHLCLTVFGEAARPLRRGRAKPGDALFAVGQIGLARTGLLRLEADGLATAPRTSPEACAAHLRPVPMLNAGRKLHDLALDHPEARIGLMDLSDGLAQDVPRLIGLNPSGSVKRKEHGPGADLALPPPHPEIARYCAANELDIDLFRLAGGEDYALIGTCDPALLPLLRQTLPELYPIGAINSNPGLRCRGAVVEPGFDHFA
jgi:thiamine-monophosphate kinase